MFFSKGRKKEKKIETTFHFIFSFFLSTFNLRLAPKQTSNRGWNYETEINCHLRLHLHFRIKKKSWYHFRFCCVAPLIVSSNCSFFLPYLVLSQPLLGEQKKRISRQQKGRAREKFRLNVFRMRFYFHQIPD
jgi:hypothetical protein